MAYSLFLANIVPSASAFTVMVNSVTRSVSSVAISGIKVLLTLSSPVVYGNIVTVTYTKPVSNPLQTTSGGQAAKINAKSVINNCQLLANQSPKVSITSPSKNSTFISPATIIIDAMASDPDGSISKVEFFNGSIKLGEVTTAPYTFIWKDVTEGTYSLTAVAIDNLNSTTVSVAVSETVINSIPTGNREPTIRITKPDNGGKYITPSTIDVTIDSYDPDGTISKVEYFLGTTKLGESITAPYSFSFESRNVGSYEIRAIASDIYNAIVSSSLVNIYVTFPNYENLELLNLFPNPNDGRFSIELLTALQNEDNIVTIISLTGETVYKGTLFKEENSRQFDLSHLKSGIYFLKVTSDEIIITKKFIKK
jgi:hypothetical protein